MAKKYVPISLNKLKTRRLKQRKSKVKLNKLGKRFAGGNFRDFLKSLPEVLAAKDFKSIVNAIIKARKKGKPVIIGMGAHPIKVGLSPVIINLMENDVITGIAMNGSCIVHDFELSLTEETGKEINKAIKHGVSKGYGIGKSVGNYILNSKLPFKKISVLAAASRLNIPATVHVAVGTDVIHMHPGADGRSIGEGSMRDFRLFASVVSNLKDGVYINLGSAVIMPEVFLKAIAVARNLKYNVKNFTTVNMDFIQHYRCRENVLRRPVLSGGSSYAITGHHEIMLPLLAAAVMGEIKN